MEIGDSFTVEKMNQAVRASAVAKQDGYKCATRKQPDGTYRVWRIK